MFGKKNLAVQPIGRNKFILSITGRNRYNILKL